MKNKTKIIPTLLMLFVVCITSLLLLTSCNGDEITDAYITNSDLPRVTYVQGQELDLSTGLLTIVLDGKEGKIPLNAEEITVTGYDKDKLGEQTLTVTYGELSASFTVNVIPRVIAENFETNYFVGDQFNKNIGKLKVADDDGKYITVNMNSNKVSLVSFDTSAAGTTTVTVRYTNGNTSYDCQFNVTVYDTSNMQFTPPTKTEYNSHKNEIDVTGGYFTILATDNKLEKKVPLTADMVTGFDPSAATMANRVTPLPQTLTVEYLGRKFEYTISITFSGVSVVEYYATGPLADLDLTGELTSVQQEAVLDAMEEFCQLTKANRALLSKEATDTIVRVGAVVISNLFHKELDNCANTFEMTIAEDEQTGKNVGNLSLVGTSYASAIADLAKIQDDESDLNVYKSILAMLAEEYPNVRIKAGQTVADIAVVYSDEMQEMLVGLLEHLIRAYKTLEIVPKDWTVESLKLYANEIERAALEIGMFDFYQNSGGGIYTDILSPWREKNDYFEIIYSYALYVYEGEDNFMTAYLFQKMPMPGLLEEWYWCLQAAISSQTLLAQNYNNTQTDGMDLWEYMYSYHSLLKIAEDIEKSGNQLWIDIYNEYGLKTLHKNYLVPYSLGSAHSQAMIDSEHFDTLWEAYYKLLVQIAEAEDPNKINLSVADLLDLYQAFEALTPSELHGFLSSISFKYANLRGNKLILYYDDTTVYNVFTGILKDGYAAYYLNDANKPLFAKLLQAMEHYALLGYERDALEDFQQLMKEIIDAYGSLSPQDKKNFNDYLGTGFEKYQAIYLKVKGEATLNITEEERALLDALEAELRKYQVAIAWAQTNAVTGEFNAMLDAIYIKATSIYKTLLEMAGEDALIELFTKEIVLVNDEQDPDDDDTYYLEKWYYDIDRENAAYLMGSIIPVADEGKTVYLTYWDAYEKYGLFELYAKMADLLYFAYMDNSTVLDTEVLASLKTDIANLTDMQRYFFIGMYADSAYHWAQSAYLKHILADETDADTVAGQLKTAAERYIEYRYYGNEEAKAAFVDAMAIAEASYGALSGEDKAALAEVYDYYLDIYEALTAQPEA